MRLYLFTNHDLGCKQMRSFYKKTGHSFSKKKKRKENRSFHFEFSTLG